MSGLVGSGCMYRWVSVCVVWMGMELWVDVVYVEGCVDGWVSGWAAGVWKVLWVSV